jgi:hypothetical protein
MLHQVSGIIAAYTTLFSVIVIVLLFRVPGHVGKTADVR